MSQVAKFEISRQSCTYQVGYEDVDGIVSEREPRYVPLENIHGDWASITNKTAAGLSHRL